MNKPVIMKIICIAVGLIIIFLCTACGCIDHEAGQQSLDEIGHHNTTMQELEAFVQNAVDFARTEGRESALKEFNDPNGEFTDGNLYIYALDYEGFGLAHPFRPDLVGVDRINETDANGMRFVEACRDVAKSGGGHILFAFPNPADGMKSEEKFGFVLPVDDQWWIGSGIYLSDLVDENGTTPASLLYVKEFVNNASSYAESESKDIVISEFCNSKGDFFDSDNGMYVIAFDYEGNVLAHPVYHDMLGENIYDNEMKYGVKSIKRGSEIARQGGGFIIYSYENDYGGLEQNLNYIMPVVKDDYWIISSGITLNNLIKS